MSCKIPSGQPRQNPKCPRITMIPGNLGGKFEILDDKDDFIESGHQKKLENKSCKHTRPNEITFNIKNFKFPSQISGNHGDSGHLGFCLGWPGAIFQLIVHHSRWLNVLFLGLNTLWRAQSSSTSSFKLI